MKLTLLTMAGMLAAAGATAQTTSPLSGQPASTSAGQAYPTRPIPLIVPFPPGGNIDMAATRDRFAAVGADILGGASMQLDEHLEHELAKWTRAAKAANIKLE